RNAQQIEQIRVVQSVLSRLRNRVAFIGRYVQPGAIHGSVSGGHRSETIRVRPDGLARGRNCFVCRRNRCRQTGSVLENNQARTILEHLVDPARAVLYREVSITLHSSGATVLHGQIEQIGCRQPIARRYVRRHIRSDAHLERISPTAFTRGLQRESVYGQLRNGLGAVRDLEKAHNDALASSILEKVVHRIGHRIFAVQRPEISFEIRLACDCRCFIPESASSSSQKRRNRSRYAGYRVHAARNFLYVYAGISWGDGHRTSLPPLLLAMAIGFFWRERIAPQTLRR